MIESSSRTDLALSSPIGDVSPMQRRIHVLVALARADLRVRYGRGLWQVVKWLLDPFALVGVYLLLRVVIFDRGGEAIGLTSRARSSPSRWCCSHASAPCHPWACASRSC